MLRPLRLQGTTLTFAICVSLAWGASGCSPSGDGSPGAATPDAPAASVVPTASAAEPRPGAAKSASSPRSPHEKPLPAFTGYTLADKKLEISSLLGKRLLLYFFNPEDKDAPVVTEAVMAISGLRRKHNFEIVGIAIGSSRPMAARFVEQQGIDFEIIDDSQAKISRRLGLRSPIAMLGVDAEGYVTFGAADFYADQPKASERIQTQISTALRLPTRVDETEPALGERPLAPVFTAAMLDSDQRFDLAAQRGKPLVLIFFLHTCPHCHQVLGFMKKALAALPEDKRPQFVGVEVSGKTGPVRDALRELDLDYFPVLFDEGSDIVSKYGAFGGVPDTVLIDAKGRIIGRVKGWQEDIDPPLMRMRLAKMAGVPVPMLLRTEGYSGNETCGICHEVEHETWMLTTHSTAFNTLVTRGADRNDECVSCHVVGFGKPGGFTSSFETKGLENVGCESCHGRGGPHQSPGFVANGEYASVCVTCHDQKHSLGFDYASFRPTISHQENAHLAKLPLAEKQALLAKRGLTREALLPTNIAHVGSDACRSCHAAEFATWQASPHAHSLKTLEAKSKADDADCLKCHTTGFGRAGGFAAAAKAGTQPDLARVGCESCHGPGADHVKEGSVKLGSILSLGDKCDSCVILQVCGSCHDDANDPGFEFAVEERIDAQRHGTIEAGTGKPKTAQLPAATQAELLTRAFSLYDERADRS